MGRKSRKRWKKQRQQERKLQKQQAKKDAREQRRQERRTGNNQQDSTFRPEFLEELIKGTNLEGKIVDGKPFKQHDFKPLMYDTPKVLLTPEVYRDMFILIAGCDIEISWLGKVEQKGKNFLITKIYLPEQSCSGTSTEMSTSGLTDLAMKIINEEGADEYNKLRFWGHSHVRMGVTPSGTDEEQTRDFKDNDWFIRSIGNKEGKMKFDIFYFKYGISLHDVEWEVYTEGSKEAEDYWKEQIQSKVSRGFSSSFRTSHFPGNDASLIQIPHSRRGESGPTIVPNDGESTPSKGSRGRVINPEVDFPRLRNYRTEPAAAGNDDPVPVGVSIEEGEDVNGVYFSRTSPDLKRIHELTEDEWAAVNEFARGEKPELEI